MRLQAEVQQPRVLGVVVVLFLLDAGVIDMLHYGGDAAFQRGFANPFRQLEHGELLRELVEDAELTAFRRVHRREFHAGERIADIEEAARLAAPAVDRQRPAQRGLDAEPIERRPPNAVVVEAGSQPFIQRRFRRVDAVHNALVQVGGAQPPDFAGEHDVVAVVHLREVIERAGLLWKWQDVLPPVVLDLDEALFDIDVGRPVFAHRAQLYQVALRKALSEEIEHVQRTRDVVLLRVHGMVAVNHGIGRRALLAVVNDHIRLKLPQLAVEEVEVRDVAGCYIDAPAARVVPGPHPLVQRADWDQAVGAELFVRPAAREVIDHQHAVAAV